MVKKLNCFWLICQSATTTHHSDHNSKEFLQLNDRDQFLYPNDGWQTDKEFQANCLVYTLFHGQNRISTGYADASSTQHSDASCFKPADGASANLTANHWIPFTEEEVNATDCFASHFMTDFLAGKTETVTVQTKQQTELDLFDSQKEKDDSCLKDCMSSQAQSVMDAGREIWRYYMQQAKSAMPFAGTQMKTMKTWNVNASLHDTNAHFKGRDDKGRMNATSTDEHFNALMDDLRVALNALAKEIEVKVYEYGFLEY